MASHEQTNRNTNVISNCSSEQDAAHAIYSELEKSVQNMKNGEVYTIEEAWEKIDKI